MLQRDIPVTRFVVLVLLTLALLLFGALATLDHLTERARRHAELRSGAQVMADQLAASLALPVWNFDQPQLDRIVDSVLHNREAQGVIIRMNDVSSGSGFKTMGLVRSPEGVALPVSVESSGNLAGALLEERSIVAVGEPVGSVKVFYTPLYMEADLRNHLMRQLFTFISFGAILTAGLYVLLWRTVMRPLTLIERFAGEVSSGGGARPSAGGRFRGELERLRGSLEKMVDLLAARYAALQGSERRIAGQLRFEELVAGISAQLVAAQPGNLRPILTRAVEDIGRMLNADRVVLGQTDEATGEMVARALYRRSEPPFPERLVISERYPGLWRTLRDGQVSHIRAVADLDAEQVDRRHFEEVGIQSQVTAPVIIEGRLEYLLAVASVGRPMEWSEEAVARIKVLAEVLATTALRCAAEEVVRSSERQFRTFIEQAPVPILLVPSPDRAPIYFNPAFTRVFGFTREDIREPEDWWPLIYPDADYRSKRQAAWAANVARAQESGGFQDSEETEMRTKSGESRFAQVRVTLVEGYRMTFINDLTERRKAETALRLTQYAVDHNPVMIFRIDMVGRFVYANDAACTHFGYAPAEILNLHIWDVAQTVSEPQWPTRAAALRDQRSTSLESVYATKEGTTFPVEVQIQYVEFSGRQHFFVFAHDITDRKASREVEHAYTRRIQKLATELTRSEERQRRELATILHDEVGQNLFAATTQLLTIRNRSENLREDLDKALSLLDIVTRDTRELTFELCPPVLYQLGLTAALQRLAEQFTSRYGIACTPVGDTAGPDDLNVRGLAYQAVRELLNNAAKHAGAKHVTLSVAETDGHVNIQVADDGSGFDAASLRPGTGGFGLFHLRERIELLGGSLSIEATQPRGCRVQLTLPMNVLQAVE